MDQSTVITVLVTSLASASLMFVAIKLLDYLRQTDAEKRAAEIMDRANRDVETRRKEAELEAKEMALQTKAVVEKELSVVRQELHERDRMLDKRQDAAEQQAEQLRKQEKMVESNQRKLAERIEETNRRNDELSKLLDLQRQTLHQVSGLSNGTPCHPSTTCGPDVPRPRMKRPPESASRVIAVIAVFAGERPGSCMIAVPRRIFFVCAAIHASGETASEPHASAVQTES